MPTDSLTCFDVLRRVDIPKTSSPINVSPPRRIGNFSTTNQSTFLNRYVLLTGNGRKVVHIWLCLFCCGPSTHSIPGKPKVACLYLQPAALANSIFQSPVLSWELPSLEIFFARHRHTGGRRTRSQVCVNSTFRQN